MKTTYKALSKFREHEPGEEFTVELDEAQERRAIERGQIKKAASKPKKEEKADG